MKLESGHTRMEGDHIEWLRGSRGLTLTGNYPIDWVLNDLFQDCRLVLQEADAMFEEGVADKGWLRSVMVRADMLESRVKTEDELGLEVEMWHLRRAMEEVGVELLMGFFEKEVD